MLPEFVLLKERKIKARLLSFLAIEALTSKLSHVSVENRMQYSGLFS